MFSVLFLRKIGRRRPFLFFISKWPLKMAAWYIFPDSRGYFFFKMAADNFFFFFLIRNRAILAVFFMFFFFQKN